MEESLYLRQRILQLWKDSLFCIDVVLHDEAIHINKAPLHILRITVR